MGRRSISHSRSQDAARLAKERATPKPRRARAAPPPEPAPEPPKAKGGRPRKWPGDTPEEREAARRAARRQAAQARTAKAFSKPAPPPKGAEPTLREEVWGAGPPKAEPELVEPGPRDIEGTPLSQLWDLMRAGYDPTVRRVVDTMLTRQKLELDDLIYLEFAELQMLLRERTKETSALALQSRKQIARLLVARGPIGGVNDVPVAVPAGMSLDDLTRPLDDGDDIHGLPPDSSLPERYRST